MYPFNYMIQLSFVFTGSACVKAMSIVKDYALRYF